MIPWMDTDFSWRNSVEFRVNRRERPDVQCCPKHAARILFLMSMCNALRSLDGSEWPLAARPRILSLDGAVRGQMVVTSLNSLPSALGRAAEDPTWCWPERAIGLMMDPGLTPN